MSGRKVYKGNIIGNHFKKVDNLERSTLLNNTNRIRKDVIPFLVTYGPTLSNIKWIISKHWHISNIKKSLGNVFKAIPYITFHKNTVLRHIADVNTIRDNQKLLQVQQDRTKREYTQCNLSRLSW